MPEEIADEKSHIRCKIIIEVLGKPKQHVEDTIRKYIDKIKDDSGLILLKSEFSEAQEKDGLYTIFAEIEIVIKGLQKLVAFCFDYMPSSVEIVKPEKFSLKADSVQDFINNLQARLHQVDMIIKKLRNENKFMKKNMNTSVKNGILISLSAQPLDMEQITKRTGIQEKELDIFLAQLVEEEKVKKQDNMYELIRE